MRRFDLVLRIAAPDRRQKAVLLSKELPILSDEMRWSTRAVAHPKISPAVIARMGRVVAGIEPADVYAAKANFEILRHEYLEALGESTTSSTSPLGQEMAYAIAWLNPDVPLKPVLEQLGTHGHGRLLLHGLPGTGKTALAHHLAEQLGRGILVKRGSDLISMWVGETEKNLRKMFEEARHEGDVLLLDEADSFLRTRNADQPVWQTAQTNELLAQMEVFDGLFVCTTNILDQLDPAVMRRFDLKVGFNPLRPEQRVGLIREACIALQLGWDTDVEAAVTRCQSTLVGLTPGDMATGLRKLRLSQAQPHAADLLEALVSECRYKSRQRQKMGFV